MLQLLRLRVRPTMLQALRRFRGAKVLPRDLQREAGSASPRSLECGCVIALAAAGTLAAGLSALRPCEETVISRITWHHRC